MWLTAIISSITDSLHYVPKCKCSTVICRAPVQWFPRLDTKKNVFVQQKPRKLVLRTKTYEGAYL